MSPKSNALNIVSKIDKESFKTSVLSDVETSYFFLKQAKVKFGSKIPISCNSWDDVIDQLGIVDSKQLQFCIQSKTSHLGTVRGLESHSQYVG